MRVRVLFTTLNFFCTFFHYGCVQAGNAFSRHVQENLIFRTLVINIKLAYLVQALEHIRRIGNLVRRLGDIAKHKGVTGSAKVLHEGSITRAGKFIVGAKLKISFIGACHSLITLRAASYSVSVPRKIATTSVNE